jgi:small-conductance mechanosensitive channel
MESNFNISELLNKIYEILNTPVFTLGDSSFSTISILIFLLSIILLFFISGLLTRLLVHRILIPRKIDVGISLAVGKIIKYIIVFIGLIIIFQTSGVDLTSLNILFGALGVGIGFGLQHIVNNFISGIIILFERPIKVGDRIEIGDVLGDVVKISARATTIQTNDNVTIIIPNSDFMNSPVINWSHNDRSIRLSLDIGVSYNEDPEKVREIVLKVAANDEGVLKYPLPQLIFKQYGDSSIDFVLRFWTSEFINRPAIIKSNLYYAIFKAFKENNIEIPFPQRDLHLRSGFENQKS